MTLEPPDSLLPDEYAANIVISLTASCAFSALLHSLESKPKEQADVIKEDVLKGWLDLWRAKSREDIAEYNKLLMSGKIQGDVTQLISPEDFQKRFDRTLKEVELSARKALWPEGEK